MEIDLLLKTKHYRKHKKKIMLNNLHRYVALEINTVKYVLDINRSLS